MGPDIFSQIRDYSPRMYTYEAHIRVGLTSHSVFTLIIFTKMAISAMKAKYIFSN